MDSTTNTVIAHAVAVSYFSALAVTSARKVLMMLTDTANTRNRDVSAICQTRSWKQTTGATRSEDTRSSVTTPRKAAGHDETCRPVPAGTTARNTVIAHTVPSAPLARLKTRRMIGWRRIKPWATTIATSRISTSFAGERKNKPRTSGTASRWTAHGWRRKTKCNGTAIAIVNNPHSHQPGTRDTTMGPSPRRRRPTAATVASAALSAQIRGSGRATAVPRTTLTS